jgi:hypothetical protein
VKLTSLLASTATLACTVLPLAPAQGVPVNWLVSGVGFDDGGALSGAIDVEVPMQKRAAP